MWPIVRDAFADASPAVRRQIAVVVLFWLALVGLQAWDSRNASGVAGVAEFCSAVLGASGVALLGAAHTLQRTLDDASRVARHERAEPGLRQVLIALPGLGFAAGVSLGAAAALMALRIFLGVELLLAIVALTAYAAMLVFAGRTVNDSARTLFQFAAAQASMAAEARGQAAAAHVAALQARMNPHFLFNALNTVAAVVRTNPPAAERLVENLADVLRTTMRRSGERMSTVGDEVEYVRDCLALEQERLGDRLRVEWIVEDAVLALPMPPLLLQPLVENALKHGIGSMAEGGTIRIAASAAHDRVTVAVEDNGPGFPAAIVERTGLGNLRERLATLYQDRAALRIDSTPAGGARVSLSIPRP
jgi:hypothetical protein